MVIRAGAIHLEQSRSSTVAGVPTAEHVCGSSAICTSAGEALYTALSSVYCT